jgi:hypothetical protein
MRNRFAIPTEKTLARYRGERDARLVRARDIYEERGDSRDVLRLIAEAKEWQRKVMWARRYLKIGGEQP